MRMDNMSTDIRNDVLMIHAGSKGSALNDDPQHFASMAPYTNKTLFTRILREIWFRCKLPCAHIWYNKQIESFEGKHLLVYDPQITREYLLWLQKHNKWTIHFYYGNKVGRARHIRPDKIPAGIPVWTYDDRDSREYAMNDCTKAGGNPRSFYEKQEPAYDVLYVGKDKGRGEFIFRLEQELKNAGMKPFVRVVGDTRFQKKKDPRYGPGMPYDEICQLIAKSRAILNVALPGQEGHTIRDTEAIWNNVKLITTNAKTAERFYYRPENILVVDEKNVTVEQIREFLDAPFIPYEPELQNCFLTSEWVREIVGESNS